MPNLQPRFSLITSVATLVLLTVAVVGCRPARDPNTLVIAIEGLPRGFDPRLSTVNSFSARIMQLIYDTLVVRNERFEFVPWLAERYEQSPDSREFVFHLRPGIRFHNGKPLTSADVKFTFESLLSPAFRSPIRGAIEKISEIEAPDPLTVIFRAREPFYTFIGNLPAIGIIPEGSGSEMINAPIGSGPFRLISYSESDGARFEANTNYWGGPPSIPRVHIRVVSDNSIRQAELMSGEVDLAFNAQFDPETVRALQRRSDITVVVEGGANVDYLGLNLSAGSKLSNTALRQAIACALDRDIIIHRLLRDQARRADAIMPPEHWAYESGIRVYEHSLVQARSLLDEAGLVDPDGDGPEPRVTLQLMTSTNQLSRNIGSIIQDQLGRVGIRIDLQSLELATLFDRISKGQFDIYYLRSIGANQSPDVFQFVYHSRYQDSGFNDAIARLRGASSSSEMLPILDRIRSILARREYCSNPEIDALAARAAGLSADQRKQLYLRIAGMLTDRGGQNRMRYCNPRLDRWIEEAERESDPEQKLRLYSEIQKTVAEDLPQIYLWYPANVLVAQSRVGSIRIEPTGSWFFISRLTLE